MPDDPAQLRDDIERTRQDTGDTVAALAEKTDVKTRAKEKVAQVRRGVTAQKSQSMGRDGGSSPGSSTAVQVRAKAQKNPVPTAAIAAFVGGFVCGRVTKRP